MLDPRFRRNAMPAPKFVPPPPPGLPTHGGGVAPIKFRPQASNPFAQMLTPANAAPQSLQFVRGSVANVAPAGSVAAPRFAPPPPAPEPPPVSAAPAPTARNMTSAAEGGRDRGDMGVQPDPNVGTDVIAKRAAEYNAASSRWHGNIGENDVRAFDQYAISYQQRTGKTPAIWDWLAAGRPTTTGDYFDDKAVEYNSYDTPFKGQFHRDDIVALHEFNKRQEALGQPGMRPEEWMMAGKPSGAAPDPNRRIIYMPKGGWPGMPQGSVPPTGPNTTPDTGGGTVTPPPVDPATAPPVTTAPPPAATDPTLSSDYEAQLEKQIADYEQRVSPLFQRQRDDIQRRAAHVGALTGAINSGGFGEVLKKRFLNTLL